MLKDILSQVVSSALSSAEDNDLCELSNALKRMESGSDDPLPYDVQADVILQILRTHNEDVEKGFTKRIAASNDPDVARAYHAIIFLLLQRLKDDIPEELFLILQPALDLWLKFINWSSSNSRNSHLPPSLDKIRQRVKKAPVQDGRDGQKPRSSAGFNKSDVICSLPEGQKPDPLEKRKVGGQIGHKGRTKVRSEADATVYLDTPPCEVAGLTQLPDKVVQVEDVIDKRFVIEYRIARWRGANRRIIEGSSQEELSESRKNLVAQNVYGSHLKARIVSLLMRNFLSFSRASELALDYYQCKVSQGSIRNFVVEAARKLRELGFYEGLTYYLKHLAHVLNSDETGINVAGRLHWAHIVCDRTATYVYPHEKRGLEGILSGGILNSVSPDTIIMHDCWATYFTAASGCRHGLCGAHLIRELMKAYEHESLRWALDMINLLITANEYKLSQGVLSDAEYKVLTAKYSEILESGREQLKQYYRIYGYVQTVSETLIKRLVKRQDEYLRYTVDAEVPLTNNMAERGFRPLKNKMNISGCFKNIEYAKDYLLVWSYLETERKQNVMSIQALEILFNNMLPEATEITKK